MKAQKEVLRHEAVLHRDRIDPGSENADAVGRLFFETINPAKDQIISLYWPKRREFDPGAIAANLFEQDRKCVLPIVQKETKELRFARWIDEMPMEEGPYKILQPVVNDKTEWLEPDIIIVPLLSFDRQGHRLGYGGGYYDATIAALRKKKNVLAVGVGYAQQAVLFGLPAEEHDICMDWIITPRKVHCFV